MRKPIRTAMLATGIAAAAAVTVLGGQSALADPPSGVTPGHTTIVGTGSDTIQAVTNQLAADRDSNPNVTKWYSWDATGTSPITEKNGCVARTRPNGSGAGISELEANLRPSGDTKDYCVDYARSSRGRASTDPTNIVFLPFAFDAVTWSADLQTETTHAPSTLSTTQLKAIYSCDASLLGTGKTGPVTWNEVGGKGKDGVVPVIPQSSSGTRSFFLGQIGVTTLGTCVQGQDNSVEENEGTNAIFSGATGQPNPADIVFPYSVAVWLSQAELGSSAPDQGSQKLRAVGGHAPLTGTSPNQKINANFPYIREVYYVVRDADTTGATLKVPGYLQSQFGTGKKNTSYVCNNATAKTDIKHFGFLPMTNCGQAE